MTEAAASFVGEGDEIFGGVVYGGEPGVGIEDGRGRGPRRFLGCAGGGGGVRRRGFGGSRGCGTLCLTGSAFVGAVRCGDTRVLGCARRRCARSFHQLVSQVRWVGGPGAPGGLPPTGVPTLRGRPRGRPRKAFVQLTGSAQATSSVTRCAESPCRASTRASCTPGHLVQAGRSPMSLVRAYRGTRIPNRDRQGAGARRRNVVMPSHAWRYRQRGACKGMKTLVPAGTRSLAVAVRYRGSVCTACTYPERTSLQRASP